MLLQVSLLVFRLNLTQQYSEPTLATDFLKRLFACQQHEKVFTFTRLALHVSYSVYRLLFKTVWLQFPTIVRVLKSLV